MKLFKKSLLSATCATLLASGAMVSTSAQAEVTAAAGVASTYYWRGLQVSKTAQVWGELTYTEEHTGLYGDLWASSEGFGVGPEYDLSAGWSGKFGDFGVNVGAVTYVYSYDNSEQGPLDDNDPGDFADAYIKLSYGPAYLNFYHNIALLQSQDWVSAGFTWDKFTFGLGYQKFEDKALLSASGYGSDVDKVDYTYAEITYAASKNLNVTVSSIIAHSDDLEFFSVPYNADTNRAKVIVSYSLPINL